MRQPTAPQSRVTPRVVAATLVAALALLVGPAVHATRATAANGDPATQRDQVRKKKAQVAARLDVLKANDAQIQRALDAMEANVSAQQARVASARQAATTAERAFADATRAEQAKQAELDTLEGRVKKLAVDAYVNPTTGDIAATLSSKSLSEATRKRELLQFRVNRNTDLVDRLKAAREDLGVKRQAADAARAKAADRKKSVETQLASYRRSLSSQEALARQVEQKYEAALAESDTYSKQEAALTSEIARRNAIAIAASRASRGGGGSTARGTGSGVGLRTVRGITVAASIADNLESMLSAAESDGYVFSGGGYRDPSGQIAVRRSNCGTSDYAIYEMPASQCSPPTARPGQSMHEQGLAIDFSWQGRVIGSRSSPAYQWLARNASGYGFYNLPSEPWHWSTNGN
jgi:LAS superfamily LD-carboxypeptidase LdcB